MRKLIPIFILSIPGANPEGQTHARNVFSFRTLNETKLSPKTKLTLGPVVICAAGHVKFVLALNAVGQNQFRRVRTLGRRLQQMEAVGLVGALSLEVVDLGTGRLGPRVVAHLRIANVADEITFVVRDRDSGVVQQPLLGV